MDRLVVSTIVGFGLVVGAMALVWYLRRRAAMTIDDPSILLSAPPEGMAPATATVVEGAPVRLAFIAGMIDLAGRGEITFVDDSTKGGDAQAGITIGGADLKDARIELNRRRPAGEAEAWLLGQLQLAAGNPQRAPWDSDALAQTNFPLMIETGAAMVGAVLRDADQTPDDQSGTSATAERERGLLSGGAPDIATVEHAYEAHTGHALPAQATQALTQMSMASATAAKESSDDTADTAATADPGGDTPNPRLYISPKQARLLTTPFLFGTFLETYARRHGWLGAMPFVTRLRWRIAGVVVAGVGIALLATGVDHYSDTWTGLGVGAFLGGLVVIWRAPAMVQPTAAGGRARAQLAAYRRTLQMTFRSAGSIEDAVGPSGLTWLTTPDEAIAWALVLGLAPDVTAVLARTDAAAATAGSADVPVSLGRVRRRRGSAAATPAPTSSAQMFVAIQDIGSTAQALPSFLRPMRSWFS